MSVNCIVATYPRSGKTFFVSTFAHNTFVKLPYTHLHEGDKEDILFDYENIVTIIRDPLESISSLITMEYTYYEDLQKTYKEDIDLLIKNKINTRIKEYENFYSIILKNSDIVIDFKKLIFNTKDIIYSVANKLNLEIKTNNFQNFVKDDPSVNFLKTSKNQQIYNEINLIIKKQNLSHCYELFNQATSIINT
jgi:hypothetical protein